MVGPQAERLRGGRAHPGPAIPAVAVAAVWAPATARCRTWKAMIRAAGGQHGRSRLGCLPAYDGRTGARNTAGPELIALTLLVAAGPVRLAARIDDLRRDGRLRLRGGPASQDR